MIVWFRIIFSGFIFRSGKGGGKGGAARVDVNPALFGLVTQLLDSILHPGICAL